MAESALEARVRGLETLLAAMQAEREGIARETERLTREIEECRKVAIDHAVLRQQFVDQQKRLEESDRRSWTLFGLILAAVLSFAANLVVAWVRK